MIYVLIALVVFRLTRLVIADTVPPLGWARTRLLRFWRPEAHEPDQYRPHWGGLGRSLAYLFTCPWCMSAWVGAITVWAFTLWVSVPLPVAAWIVSSAVTGLLATWEDSKG